MARMIDADRLLRELTALSHGGETPGWTYEGLRLLIERQPTHTQPNEWVSVDEKLPKEKQRVIVRCERVGTSVGWILWGNWMADIGPDAGKITHWMPLPAPPYRRPPEGEEDT